MERPKHIVILLLFVLGLNIRASDKSDIYNAYVNNNMTKWKNVIDRMEAVKDKNNTFTIELVNYQYGYIAWCIGNNRNAEAKKYLELAENNLSFLSKEKKNLSVVNAYKAAFYGYKIGFNKLMAPFFGHKSIDCAKLAIELDSEDPLGYIQYGNIQFYMPSVFGGSKEEAIKFYTKAEKLMEKDRNYVTENWNYLSLLTVIAQSYSYIDNLKSSMYYMEKILKIEPAFGYVKNELYPQLLNKMKK